MGTKKNLICRNCKSTGYPYHCGSCNSNEDWITIPEPLSKEQTRLKDFKKKEVQNLWEEEEEQEDI